jgi:serine/threonine-protein kinase HipA
VLIGEDQSVRLAPLYDVASILPYPGIQVPKLKMAMKIGGEYRLRQIGIRQWRKLANEVRVDEDELIQQLRTLAEEIPDHTSKLRKEVP